MDALAKLITGIAWPALFLFVGYYFRSEIRAFFHLLRQQLASGAALKWEDLEFRGIDLLSFENRDGRTFARESADKVLFDRRHESYSKNKNLFLVHRVRPTGELHKDVKLPTYDISIYLISHKNFGRLNDVKEVQYYFGQFFGASKNQYGSKYIVENGTDGFAVRINAYGPTLCEARIIFHDGSETTVSRYLDFEGTEYQFRADTNTIDADKIKGRRVG
jgi:hypothetical protein